jgi:type IV pilus assembly protein PilX
MSFKKMQTKQSYLQTKIMLPAFNPRVKNRGVALITVMLFLIALTGLAVWTARQSLLGEGMARNQLDRAAATQAAEAALRDAERDLTTLTSAIRSKASCSRLGREGPPNVAEFSADCSMGYCIKDNESDYAKSDWSLASISNKFVAESWWPAGKGGDWNNTFIDKPDRTAPTLDTTHCNFKGGVPLGTYTGVAPITGVAIQPEYLVELYNMTKISPVTKQEEKVYRITARGFGYTQRTQVVLQTIFIPLQE